MNYLMMILIGVGLSLNVLSVSVGQGAVLAKVRSSKLFEMGIILSLWQLVAFIIGYYVTNLRFISDVGNENPESWKLVSAVILIVIALLKIIELSVTKNGEERLSEIKLKKVFSIAAINSIYAFGAGIASGFLNFQALINGGFIAAMTFVVVLIGVILGYYKGMAPRKVYSMGSFALILIGVLAIVNYVV